jgi:hypothetical protein
MPQEPPQVVLSGDRYGKAEVRLLHVDRVFYAADRPYALIEGTVSQAGAPEGDPEHRW